MSLLAAPALLLLLSLPLLLWLALRRQQPVQHEVGTLLIWKRVARKAEAQARRGLRLDLLLMLCAGAALLGATGAARPALLLPTEQPRVAVFIERLGVGPHEPALAEGLARARAEFPQADLELYMPLTARPPGLSGDVIMLSPGSIEQELAQFEARTTYADTRLLLLCRPTPEAARLGRVIPRTLTSREGVLFGTALGNGRLVLRATPGPQPEVEGANPVSVASAGNDVLYEYSIIADRARVSDAHGHELTLKRRPFVVGVGPEWSTSRHAALFNALETDSADAGPPEFWLGTDQATPAIRVQQGESADLAQAEITYNATHALFAELPLGAFDWTREGKLMQPRTGYEPLVSAWQGESRLGELVAHNARRGVLVFAGDPFTAAPIADAALLLDNAIGVLTGERATQRSRFSAQGELPRERAAKAEAFEAYGRAPEVERMPQQHEAAQWLLLLAALFSAAAAFWALKR